MVLEKKIKLKIIIHEKRRHLISDGEEVEVWIR
jgi:hypothetical protein